MFLHVQVAHNNPYKYWQTIINLSTIFLFISDIRNVKSKSVHLIENVRTIQYFWYIRMYMHTINTFTRTHTITPYLYAHHLYCTITLAIIILLVWYYGWLVTPMAGLICQTLSLIKTFVPFATTGSVTQYSDNMLTMSRCLMNYREHLIRSVTLARRPTSWRISWVGRVTH